MQILIQIQSQTLGRSDHQSWIIDMAGEWFVKRNWGMLAKSKLQLSRRLGFLFYICSSLKSDSMIEAAERPRMVLTLLLKKGFMPETMAPSMLKSRVLFGLIKGLLPGSLNMERILLSGIVEAEGVFSYGDIVTVFDKGKWKITWKRTRAIWSICFGGYVRSQNRVSWFTNDWISITPEIQLLYRDFRVNYGDEQNNLNRYRLLKNH